MAKRYWVMKCEPGAYSIDDLERDGRTSWEGVRNYQARNFMKEMRVGDGVLFYASNADPSGVTGIARVCREAYVDEFQFDRKHDYYDPDSDPSNPRWVMVDIEFVRKFSETVPLDKLKKTKGLENLLVTKKGNRLSVTPATKEEFDIVSRLG